MKLIIFLLNHLMSRGIYLLIQTFLTSSRYAVCLYFLFTGSVPNRVHVHANDQTCVGTAKTLAGK